MTKTTTEGVITKGSSQTWESPRGGLVISHPVIGVIVFTYWGHMSVGAVAHIEKTVDRVLAVTLRPPDLFIDLEQMTGYDSDYRQAVTKWGARTQKAFGEVRVLVRSKIVAMGIAVSNLTAGGTLKPTTKRAEFEGYLAAAVARHSVPLA